MVSRHFGIRAVDMATSYQTINGLVGYKFGDDGTVWSQWKRSHGCYGEFRKMRPRVTSDGYLAVGISTPSGRKQMLVHVLILTAFVGPRPMGMEACHGNGIRDDARLVNLRWDTRRNNALDKRIHGTDPQGEKNPTSKLTESDVAEIRSLVAAGQTHREVAGLFCVRRHTVTQIVNGVRWPHSFRKDQYEMQCDEYHRGLADE